MKQAAFNFLVAGLFLVSQVQGDLHDHFKKVEYKSDMRTIENIDFIYLINLDQRKEKYNKVMAQCAPSKSHGKLLVT